MARFQFNLRTLIAVTLTAGILALINYYFVRSGPESPVYESGWPFAFRFDVELIGDCRTWLRYFPMFVDILIWFGILGCVVWVFNGPEKLSEIPDKKLF
jgi:hypothetical protein